MVCEHHPPLLVGVFCYFILPEINKKIEINFGRDFSETACTPFELTPKQKDNISNLMEGLVYENEEYWGFKSYNESLDLYYANSLVEIACTLNDTETLDSLKTSLNLLKPDLNTMNLLNIIYYTNICNNLDLDFANNEIINALEKYYDNQEKIFFLDSKNDLANIKIIITALCCRMIPDLLTCDKFDIGDGVKNIYDNYVFAQDPNSTLYNSGGDILYCYSVLGYIDQDILTKHKAWFDYWKIQYEKMPINNIESALEYSEYYNVAVIFDDTYSNEKLRQFYHELTPQDIPDDIDYYYLNNALKNVKVYDNMSFNVSVMDKIQPLAKSDLLIKSEIDLLTTTYGMQLAESVGFSYNREKLQNYINQKYKDISDMDNPYDRINTLYYTIILDQTVNQYVISWDYKNIQKIIDKAIKSLEFKENINNDINAARKALEIVVELQMRDPDVIDLGLSSGQKNKLRKGVEIAIGNDLIMNSVLITDAFIIDKFLEFNMIDNDTFIRVYNSLTTDGGTRICSGQEYPAEIFATSRFFECFSMINNNSYLKEQKKFVSTLMVDDGMYALNSDKPTMDLSSILYGNGIDQFLRVGMR